MSPKPPLMLFAAGLGTRMRPLTDKLPKPLVEVAGGTLIDHAIGLAHDAGIGKIVANTHYLSEMLERHLEGKGVATVFEPELLDTGGGIRNALPLLRADTVVTLNTDAVWRGDNPLAVLLDAWQPDRMEAMLLLVPKNGAIGHMGSGDFGLNAKGCLRRGSGHVYTGAQIMKIERLRTAKAGRFSLNEVWDGMISGGGLFGLEYGGRWCDVGRPECIPLAERLLDV